MKAKVYLGVFVALSKRKEQNKNKQTNENKYNNKMNGDNGVVRVEYGCVRYWAYCK